MPNEPAPAALRQDLASAGFALAVEARDKLAVLTPVAGAAAGLTDEDRRLLQALARRHGFTHAAIEILPP